MAGNEESSERPSSEFQKISDQLDRINANQASILSKVTKINADKGNVLNKIKSLEVERRKMAKDKDTSLAGMKDTLTSFEPRLTSTEHRLTSIEHRITLIEQVATRLSEDRAKDHDKLQAVMYLIGEKLDALTQQTASLCELQRAQQEPWQNNLNNQNNQVPTSQPAPSRSNPAFGANPFFPDLPSGALPDGPRYWP